MLKLFFLVIPLRCCVKKYEWGKKGLDSAVARFVKNQIPSYEVDPDSPHAEVFCLNLINS
jgi:competence protein ComGC